MNLYDNRFQEHGQNPGLEVWREIWRRFAITCLAISSSFGLKGSSAITVWEYQSNVFPGYTRSACEWTLEGSRRSELFTVGILRALGFRSTQHSRYSFPNIDDGNAKKQKKVSWKYPLPQSSVLSPGLLFFAFLIFSRRKLSSDSWASHIRLRVFWDFVERQTYARNREDPWLEESAVNKKSVYFFRSFISRPEIGDYSQSTPIFSFPLPGRNFTLIE